MLRKQRFKTKNTNQGFPKLNLNPVELIELICLVIIELVADKCLLLILNKH